MKFPWFWKYRNLYKTDIKIPNSKAKLGGRDYIFKNFLFSLVSCNDLIDFSLIRYCQFWRWFLFCFAGVLVRVVTTSRLLMKIMLLLQQKNQPSLIENEPIKKKSLLTYWVINRILLKQSSFSKVAVIFEENKTNKNFSLQHYRSGLESQRKRERVLLRMETSPDQVENGR